MSEYIKLEDAEKAIWGASMYDGRVFVEDALARIADKQTIDIVRCGECENNKCNTDGVAENWCFKFGYDVESDDFCSYGERNQVYTGEIKLTEDSSQALLRILQEQDSEFINKVFDGEYGFTLKSSDGRSVQFTPKEIVLCKDCKYSYTGNYFRGYACRLAGDDDQGLPNDINEADGYCHRGERRK